VPIKASSPKHKIIVSLVSHERDIEVGQLLVHMKQVKMFFFFFKCVCIYIYIYTHSPTNCHKNCLLSIIKLFK